MLGVAACCLPRSRAAALLAGAAAAATGAVFALVVAGTTDLGAARYDRESPHELVRVGAGSLFRGAGPGVWTPLAGLAAVAAGAALIALRPAPAR